MTGPISIAAIQSALGERYVIRGELGRGGTAFVYLAEDVKHHRLVAVKVLSPDLGSVLGPARFLREIEIAAGLQHPHILPLYDSGETNGILYYVMPRVHGESLRQRLNREKQLPIEDALTITRQVAEALASAHAQGVIHRDIKPENILLERGHALVADFGIARAIGSAVDRLTSTGLTIGTPTYMSPEQSAGTRDLDARSDIYSLGCVLYEMLAGQPPFAASTVDGLVRQHLLASPQRVRLVRPTVSPEVEVIVQRALAKAPADRFVTAAALSAAVTGALGSGGTIGLPERGHLRKRRRSAAALGIAAALGFAAIVTISLRNQGEEEFSFPRTAVAVLPFRNLSADSANAYFAAGLHEELVTHFAKILSLSVRGRASSLGYAGSRKSISEIANDLRVGSVVEGSVQVVGDRLRVNVQLIDAATEEHVWADSYDRTLDDVFLVQSDVVRNIVGAVGGVLRHEEKQALARAPTQNVEAYRLYLQGREYDNRPGRLRHNWEIAQQLYERALATDPGFALAHAALSRVHGRLHWWRYDPSPERSSLQRKEAEEALRIDSALPEAHIAMGLWHYLAQRNYQAALGEFETALQRAPGDVELVESIAAVHRRLGRWRAVEEGFQRAVELDPRNADTFFDIGAHTYLLTRRYEDAVDASNRALELAPDFIGAAVRKGWSYALWQGQLDTLRAVLQGQRREADLGPYGTVAAQRAFLLLLDRKPAELIAHLDSTEASLLEGYDFYYPKGLWYAWAHELLTDVPAAQLAYQSAMTFIDSVHHFFPDDARLNAARGLALAGLNRHVEARRDASWLEKSRYVREDALLGPVLDYDRCLVLAGIGDVPAALDGIERLLSNPSRTSIHTLRMDPRWDPLRDHPRFRQLVVQFASR